MSISTKPASGFRDFLPQEVRRREHVFGIVRQVYTQYGFEPLETPCFERLDTLLGKYGAEGDQLIFKVLQRGDKLKRALRKDDPQETDLADMGLRYDLTVPLARVYAQHKNELPRYFKRYQLAPVWRADRPQKGRFREFYQCDVDVVGSTSMTVEAEVTAALAEILRRLNFEGARIHVNHRTLLQALIERAGIAPEQEMDALVSIDKLDKMGEEGVAKELTERGMDDAQVEALMKLLSIRTTGTVGAFTNEATLDALDEAVGSLKSGRTAIDELRQLLQLASRGPAEPSLFIDPYLARGLSYYTGPIFEIRSDDFQGSLGGGGRYDGLIGMFSKQNVPACGFSLGIERILVLMEEREMFEDTTYEIDALVTIWSEEDAAESVAVAHELRASGLCVDLYPDADRYKKQFKYADERGIPLVVILGKDEIAQGQASIKDLRSGAQETVARKDLAETICGKLEPYKEHTHSFGP